MIHISRPCSLLALALLSLAFMGSAHAAGDVARGKNKSTTCQACHGPDGNSPVPTFPVIAGQHRDYLLQSLKSYRPGGERNNAIMQAIVMPLSDQDMEDLAAYYAAQKGLFKIDAGLGAGAP